MFKLARLKRGEGENGDCFQILIRDFSSTRIYVKAAVTAEFNQIVLP